MIVVPISAYSVMYVGIASCTMYTYIVMSYVCKPVPMCIYFFCPFFFNDSLNATLTGASMILVHTGVVLWFTSFRDYKMLHWPSCEKCEVYQIVYYVVLISVIKHYDRWKGNGKFEDSLRGFRFFFFFWIGTCFV